MVCSQCRKRRNRNTTTPPYNTPNIDLGSQAIKNRPYTDFVDYMQDKGREYSDPGSRMIPMKKTGMPAMRQGFNYDNSAPQMYTRMYTRKKSF